MHHPPANRTPMIGTNPMANNIATPVLWKPSKPPKDNVCLVRAKIQKMMYENFGIQPKLVHILYRKPCPDYFDHVPYPKGYKVPDFVKFNRSDGKSTWEHTSQYLAPLGKASNSEPINIRLFSLSLTHTTFSWFSALPPSFLIAWYDLEKFHEHFYSRDNDLKLCHLKLIKQKQDELVTDYVKCFRETKWQGYR
jgi:hypothetical protein